MGNSNASMSNVDTRQVNRDSLFLLAQLRVDGQEAVYRVKVRNLSAGGMMAEGEAKATRGALVMVELRNIGWPSWTRSTRPSCAVRVGRRGPGSTPRATPATIRRCRPTNGPIPRVCARSDRVRLNAQAGKSSTPAWQLAG